MILAERINHLESFRLKISRCQRTTYCTLHTFCMYVYRKYRPRYFLVSELVIPRNTDRYQPKNTDLVYNSSCDAFVTSLEVEGFLQLEMSHTALIYGIQYFAGTIFPNTKESYRVYIGT
jgi:hypothetical protein